MMANFEHIAIEVEYIDGAAFLFIGGVARQENRCAAVFYFEHEGIVVGVAVICVVDRTYHGDLGAT